LLNGGVDFIIGVETISSRRCNMNTVSVHLDLPKDILLAANITETNASADLRKLIALYLFSDRVLSFSKAAELSGMDKLSFLEFAGNRGISLNYDIDDYTEDMQTLKRLAI